MKFIAAFSIIVLLILLIQGKIKPYILFGSLAVLYYLLGYLTLDSYLDSYTNSSLIVLVLLLLISIVIEKSTIIEYFSKIIISKNYYFSLFRLGVIVSSISAFLNNTAVVASFIGLIKNNKYQLPSKLLIPLSYFSIVGGTMTLIGTSTNLIVNSFVVENGLSSLKMFDFFIVGFCITFISISLIIIFSFLLPDYQRNIVNLSEYLISAKVLQKSLLIGKSVKENRLRELESLFLLEIQRNGQSITPISSNMIIEENDILIFSGDISCVDSLRYFDGLEIGSFKEGIADLKLVDVIVVPTSNLIGKTVKEVNFRARFNAGIIAFKRGAINITKIGKNILEAGDRLILGVGEDFHTRDNIAKNFYIISSINKQYKLNNKQSLLVITILLFIIILSALGVFSLLKSLLVFLIILFFLKFINLDEIKRRFPLEIFIVVGSSLAITKVLIDSGLANDFAYLIIGIFGDFGVYGSFIGVYLLTLLLTEIITNNAAAALVFPIAFATALALNVNPMPFIFAVAYGASAGFMMPHGYQTHLMVASVCGYKTTDFIKIGWIVSLGYSLVVISLVPVIFEF